MVYTLTQGAHNYNSRLHYSLYGGVEYHPERVLALKELLPLVAIPIASIAILTAMLSFHVPNLSPTTGTSGNEGSKPKSNRYYSLVLSPSTSSASSGQSRNVKSGNVTIPSIANPATPLTQAPLGTDNGQGIIGGMGGGSTTSAGTGTTTTVPTGSTTVSSGSSGSTTGIATTVSSPLTQAGASASLSTSTNTAQAGVDVFLSPTGTSLSSGTSITP